MELARKTGSMGAVVFESVSKSFTHRPALFNSFGRERKGHTRALSKITLAVPAGNILVLLGPNGSGKTTLLKLVSTMLLPDSGRVLVNASDTVNDSQSVRCQVGFAVASERSFFPRLSARENLDFFATLEEVPRNNRSEKVERFLDTVGLLEQADTLVMKFSSGMYQRLGIARALIKNPSILLLDEPTRSVDPGSAQHCWTIVRELAHTGTTVLLATHSFQEAARVADDVAILFHGTLAARHRLGATSSIDDLRELYFQTTGEMDETRDAIPQGVT
jgi:ABC-2 type transport system ATP-binding protein